MDYLSDHMKIEYGGNSTSIFSGGLIAQSIMKNNSILSNINSQEKYDRFKDLYVPVGLQINKYTVTTIKPKIKYNENVINDRLFDTLYENVKSKKIPKNPFNKTQKKKRKN